MADVHGLTYFAYDVEEELAQVYGPLVLLGIVSTRTAHDTMCYRSK